MDKINLGDGTQGSGDNGLVGGGKINANYIALVQAVLGVTIWSSATSENLDLTTLNTTDKSSIKAAINELLERTKLIDNSLTSSIFKTWSVDKLVATFIQATDLAGYLPLAGGDLTGTLNGTNASFSGNVGIGTTSPSEVSSDATTLEISGAVTNKSGALRLTSSDSSLSSYFYHQSSGLSMATVTAQPIKIITNDTEKVRIESGGNFGIGTPNPNEKLEVNGNIKSSGTVLPQSNNVQTITGSTASVTIGSNINVVVVNTNGNITLTIATGTNIASIKIIDIGPAGEVDFSAGTDVTINNMLHNSILTTKSSGTLTKIGPNSWIVSK